MTKINTSSILTKQQTKQLLYWYNLMLEKAFEETTQDVTPRTDWLKGADIELSSLFY